MKAELLAEVSRVDEGYNLERKDYTDKIAALTKDLDKYKGLYTEAQKAMDAAKAQLQFQPTPTSKRDEGRSKKKPSESEEKAKEAKSKDRSMDKKKEVREEKGKEKTKQDKEDKEEKGKEKEKRGQSKDFFVSADEVPTELEPDDAEDAKVTINTFNSFCFY